MGRKRAISPFPTEFLKGLYSRYVKIRLCLGKVKKETLNQLSHGCSVDKVQVEIVFDKAENVAKRRKYCFNPFQHNDTF